MMALKKKYRQKEKIAAEKQAILSNRYYSGIIEEFPIISSNYFRISII